MYLDANNLYGWAVNQYLPFGRFKQLHQNEINKFDVNCQTIAAILQMNIA